MLEGEGEVRRGNVDIGGSLRGARVVGKTEEVELVEGRREEGSDLIWRWPKEGRGVRDEEEDSGGGSDREGKEGGPLEYEEEEEESWWDWTWPVKGFERRQEGSIP